MKVLVVWAHPEPNSFNGALVDAAHRALADAGHEVRITDLYREGFAAVASAADFTERQRPERLVYDEEQLAAAKRGGLDEEIARHVADLQWCDQLILQFPLWWFSVPAILKGWIDRVMVKGVAYGGGRWYDRGGFTGRRALLSITTAAYEQMCSPDGINGAMDVILWPLQQGVLRFVGFETLAPQIIWAANYIDDSARKEAIRQHCDRLLGLADEAPEPAHSRADFGSDWRFLPDVRPFTAGQWNMGADRVRLTAPGD